MTQAIWIHYARPRPHWYGLTADRQDSLRSEWEAVRTRANQAGAVFEGRFHIRGQHDFETVEIWRFGSTQDAFDHWAALCDAGYSEHFAFSNNVGLEIAT